MLNSGLRKYLVVGAALFVAGPLVLLVGHMMFGRWFLPSDYFQGWVVPVIVLFATAWFALLLPLLISMARDLHWIGWLALPLGTFVGAAVGLWMLSGSASYALHMLSSPAETTQVEEILAKKPSSGWRDPCGPSLRFRSAAPHLGRKLCRVPDELFQAVHVGDRLVLEGTSSPFGFAVAWVRPLESGSIEGSDRPDSGND